MNRLSSNLLAAVLLATIATVSVAGQDVSLMVAAQARPAGCHQHGTAPVPQPVSYRCCQSGHDFAILQVSLSSHLDSACVAVFGPLLDTPAPIFTLQSLPGVATSSADPPDIAPLRV
jgi:hypothetical protein